MAVIINDHIFAAFKLAFTNTINTINTINDDPVSVSDTHIQFGQK